MDRHACHAGYKYLSKLKIDDDWGPSSTPVEI